MTTRLATCTLLFGLGSLTIAEPAQAGFLDELARAMFGRPAPTRFVPDELAPFEMTVRPRTRKTHSSAAAKPKRPEVKLDPATEPYWYLRDPTLRRGDIVVARSGVLVFEGGRDDQHDVADFVSLEHSRYVSRGLKQRVAASAAGHVLNDERTNAVAMTSSGKRN